MRQRGLGLSHFTYHFLSQLVSYPSATIVQLLSEIQGRDIEGTKRPAIDLQLLRSFQSIIKTLVTLSHKESYATRLATCIDVLIDLAAAAHASSPLGPPVPPSEPTRMHSLPSLTQPLTKYISGFSRCHF